jgi:hypothetical protein
MFNLLELDNAVIKRKLSKILQRKPRINYPNPQNRESKKKKVKVIPSAFDAHLTANKEIML